MRAQNFTEALNDFNARDSVLILPTIEEKKAKQILVTKGNNFYNNNKSTQ